MRADGATLQQIGDHFGVSRERIRQVVGPPFLAPAACEHCGGALPETRHASRRFCSPRCQRNSKNEQRMVPCPQCNGKKAPLAKMCRACHVAANGAAQSNALVVELWARGESISTIAAALDTTVNCVGARIQRMRGEGYDLPYRRRVFLNGKPAHPEQEIREYRPEPVSVLKLNTREIVARGRERRKRRARRQFYLAVERGDIVRPDTCSRCGESARIEAHHADYDKPLEVEWLCFPCHRRTHVEAKAAA